MKQKFFLLILAQCVMFNICQCQDSLLLKRDLVFKSSLERTHYTAYFRDKDKAHFPYLLLGVSDSITDASVGKVTKEIDDLVNSLKISGIEKRNPKRKVKEIYDFVHKTMLKKYSLISRFEEIFTTGTYNCVTATALYSLIFEALDVPYEIKEKPTHVFLLAYPNSDNILVETTTPFFGYISFDENYKQNFINTLKSLKLVTEQDIKNKPIDELFNTYYFKDQKIELSELVGIHYVNDALYRSDEHDDLGAFRQVEKGWFYFPVPKTEYLLKSLGTNAVEVPKLEPKVKSDLVVKVANFKSLGISDDMIRNEFIMLTRDVLYRNNNKTLYNDCYALYMNGIRNPSLKDEIAYVYNYESGRFYANQGSIRRARPYYQRALTLQPNNVDISRMFLGTLLESLRRNEPRTVVDSLQFYSKTFPSLADFEVFKSLLGDALLSEVADEFEHNREGLSPMRQFETLLKSNPDLGISKDNLGRAYVAASEYYQRKNQSQKSKDIAAAGLVLDPGNYLITQRMKRFGR